MTGKAQDIPEWLWAAFTAGLLTAVVGAMRVWAGPPWLFPSLGPMIFLQVHQPDQEFSRPFNVVVGHGLGILAAIVGVILTGAGMEPSAMEDDVLSWPRVWAAAIAMALTLLSQVSLQASHPPAAATALLIALGDFSVTWDRIIVLSAGILLTAALGEGLRRMRAKDP